MSYLNKVLNLEEGNRRKSRGIGPARMTQSSQQKAFGESPAEMRRETMKNIADKSGTASLTPAQRRAKMKALASGQDLERSIKPGVSVKAKRTGFKAFSQSIGESFVYAFDMWSLMLAENQFASRPGGDGSGEKKGRESQRRAFINTQTKIKKAKKRREQFPSDETIKRRIAARNTMDAKIRKMMGMDE